MKFDKKIIIIILVSIVAALFLEISDGERDIEKSDLKKPGYSGAEKNLDVSIYAGKNRIDTTITIEPEKYTAQETEELFFNVYEHLKKEILNDNASLDEIKTDLNLIEKLEDNPVSIEWFSSNYNLIGYDGKVYNDDLKKDQKEEVTLTANLQYMEYSSSYEIKVIVCGRELTHEEQLKKDIFYEIKCAQSDYNSDYVELPKEVDGEEVIYKKRESGNYAAAVLFCGISLAIFAHYHDKEKKNRCCWIFSVRRKKYGRPMKEKSVKFFGKMKNIRKPFFVKKLPGMRKRHGMKCRKKAYVLSAVKIHPIRRN